MDDYTPTDEQVRAAEKGVERAWRSLGLPGDPPRDPKDATLYVPVTYGSVRDTATPCTECDANVHVATVYGMTRDSTFPVGTLRVCDCVPPFNPDEEPR